MNLTTPSPEQLKACCAHHNIERWDTDTCGICSAPIGYVFQNGRAFFDGGCDCTTAGARIVGWDDVAETYAYHHAAQAFWSKWLITTPMPPAPSPLFLVEETPKNAFPQSICELGNLANLCREDGSKELADEFDAAVAVLTAAALPPQYKQERPATAWMPIYQGCKLPERGEWGEWCVLLNNYGESALEPRFGRLCGDDEGGLFWHLDNQEAWAFENFTHYIVLPGRPSAHDTVNRASLAAATPVATVGSEPAFDWIKWGGAMQANRAQVAIQRLLDAVEFLLPKVPKARLDGDDLEGLHIAQAYGRDAFAELKKLVDEAAASVPAPPTDEAR